jgi:hypothetical protein
MIAHSAMEYLWLALSGVTFGFAFTLGAKVCGKLL